MYLSDDVQKSHVDHSGVPWHSIGHGSLTMVLRDNKASGNLSTEFLGEPANPIIAAAGVLLVKRK